MITKINEFTINEVGNPEELNKTDYNKFIKDYLDNLYNSIIMSMLNRMLDNNTYVKFGKTVYKLTDSEKNKLQELKPKLQNLLSEIHNIEKLI